MREYCKACQQEIIKQIDYTGGNFCNETCKSRYSRRNQTIRQIQLGNFQYMTVKKIERYGFKVTVEKST